MQSIASSLCIVAALRIEANLDRVRGVDRRVHLVDLGASEFASLVGRGLSKPSGSPVVRC